MTPPDLRAKVLREARNVSDAAPTDFPIPSTGIVVCFSVPESVLVDASTQFQLNYIDGTGAAVYSGVQWQPGTDPAGQFLIIPAYPPVAAPGLGPDFTVDLMRMQRTAGIGAIPVLATWLVQR